MKSTCHLAVVAPSLAQSVPYETPFETDAGRTPCRRMEPLPRRHRMRCGSPRTALQGAPGPGTAQSPATRNLRLLGSGFRPHTFASGFVGPETAILPAGNGVRCIAAGSSLRLTSAPTRENGTPRWTLDLTYPAMAPMIGIGEPFSVQALYRDGVHDQLQRRPARRRVRVKSRRPGTSADA